MKEENKEKKDNKKIIHIEFEEENEKLEIKDRQKDILKAIVEEYISTALPVSSGEILKKYNMDISSATIRNEMVELEKSGLIEKPYLSSGRIPSEIGYRYYVDNLIKTEDLSLEEVKYIKEAMDFKKNELENLSKTVIRTISELTHYTALALEPSKEDDIISDIQFVYLKSNLLMVVLITRFGIIKESIISFEENIDIKTLKNIENIFKKRILGLRLKDVNEKIAEEILKSIEEGIEIARRIIKAINLSLRKMQQIEVEGANKTFRLPEFKEGDTAEKFLDLLDDKETLIKVFNETNRDSKEGGISNIEIIIGDENEEESLKDFSVIKLEIGEENKPKEKIGIIGPKRMNYKKVLEILKSFSKLFGKKETEKEDEKIKENKKNEKNIKEKDKKDKNNKNKKT